MRPLVLAVALIAAVGPTAYRSRGYAGSTPVGLGGYAAFARFDCATINADPRRSYRRVPLSNDCTIAIPSPDGHLTVVASPTGDDTIRLRGEGGLSVGGLEQPTVLLWHPQSTGLLLNDSEGSGQVSRLRYFKYDARGWHESRLLAAAASALYRRRFDCRSGKRSYTNVSGWDWTASGLLRVIVQEGVHSAGCLQPHKDRNVLFEVIGDPATGRIASAREIETLA